jgi:hypothetical protein
MQALMKSPHRFALVVLFCSLTGIQQSFAQFTQQGPKLVGSGAVDPATQGIAVSISADGNTAIVGGDFDNDSIGAAWVWNRSGAIWSQQGSKLVGAGAVARSRQGDSVALSADGNTAIIGGHGDNPNAGALWVWTRSGATWSQQGPKLVGSGAIGSAQQGWSVGMSADGNIAVAGGNGDNGGAGAVWVWIRSGGVWSQEGSKLTGSGGSANAGQGSSVAVSGDGNTAIVGGSGDNSSAGAAWVWTRSGGVWAQQGAKLVGTGAAGNAHQGTSVALSADGNTAIVGGHRDNGDLGAAWVWIRSGGVWTQQGAKLVGSGAVPGPAGVDQGASVSLSADGNTALVGGYGDSNFVGATWVWKRSGGVWTQQGSKLVGSGALTGGGQGFAVSLSGDATTAIVGGASDNNDAGAAWVFVDLASWHPSAVPTFEAFAGVILLLSIAVIALFRLR